MEIDNKSFSEIYTAIVIQPDAIKSVIVEERHFKTKSEAEFFKIRQIIEGYCCIVCPVSV